VAGRRELPPRLKRSGTAPSMPRIAATALAIAVLVASSRCLQVFALSSIPGAGFLPVRQTAAPSLGSCLPCSAHLGQDCLAAIVAWQFSRSSTRVVE